MNDRSAPYGSVSADDPEVLAHLSAGVVQWTADAFERVSEAHADLAKLKRLMNSGAFLRKARKDPAAAAEQIQELTAVAGELFERTPDLNTSLHHIQVTRYKRKAQAADQQRWAEQREAAVKRREELVGSDTPFVINGTSAEEPWLSKSNIAKLHHAGCASLRNSRALAYGPALTEDQALAFLHLRPDLQRTHSACVSVSADTGSLTPS